MICVATNSACDCNDCGFNKGVCIFDTDSVAPPTPTKNNGQSSGGGGSNSIWQNSQPACCDPLGGCLMGCKGNSVCQIACVNANQQCDCRNCGFNQAVCVFDNVESAFEETSETATAPATEPATKATATEASTEATVTEAATKATATEESPTHGDEETGSNCCTSLDDCLTECDGVGPCQNNCVSTHDCDCEGCGLRVALCQFGLQSPFPDEADEGTTTEAATEGATEAATEGATEAATEAAPEDTAIEEDTNKQDEPDCCDSLSECLTGCNGMGWCHMRCVNWNPECSCGECGIDQGMCELPGPINEGDAPSTETDTEDNEAEDNEGETFEEDAVAPEQPLTCCGKLEECLDTCAGSEPCQMRCVSMHPQCTCDECGFPGFCEFTTVVNQGKPPSQGGGPTFPTDPNQTECCGVLRGCLEDCDGKGSCQMICVSRNHFCPCGQCGLSAICDSFN